MRLDAREGESLMKYSDYMAAMQEDDGSVDTADPIAAYEQGIEDLRTAVAGMTAAQVQDLLYRDCGLKGLSGLSNDMRELQTSADPRAAFAVEYFVYRVGLHAGMLAAALGGLDAFVFTGGIGENSPMIRALIAHKLGWLGAALDPDANLAQGPLISQRGRVALYVIPTDEELMIARHTLATISARHRPQSARMAMA